MDITGGPNIAVGADSRYFHVGKVGRQLGARKKDIDGYYLTPQLRVGIQNWEYSAKMGSCDLEVSSAQADFNEIQEVKKVAVSMQER